MKKWSVNVNFAIQAETRMAAWQLAQELCERKLRGLAYVTSVGLIELRDPAEYIAVNEPIRAQG